MPRLDTTLHLEMLKAGKKRRSFLARVARASKILLGRPDVYGYEWGDPETLPPLQYLKDTYVRPFVTPESTVLEIGVVGGRWTQYLLWAKKLYVVDIHQELLDELRSNFDRPNMVFIRNHGDDFPGVPADSVDFLFSFGTFVHLDTDIIAEYLAAMKPILHRGANVVLHYSDKTKPLGKADKGFSENEPVVMRGLVEASGYSIAGEDTQTLWHSSIIHFVKP